MTYFSLSWFVELGFADGWQNASHSQYPCLFLEIKFAYLKLFKIEPFIFMSFLFVILSETFART